jgi:hypothetical protein
MMFSGGVLSLVVPTTSFLDRFTPNLFGAWDIVAYTRGISCCSGSETMCGSITFSKTTVDHIQNQKNVIFLISGHRQPFETKPSGHSDTKW